LTKFRIRDKPLLAIPKSHNLLLSLIRTYRTYRDVTPKTKTQIYHAIVKSTITYAEGTWCLKAKTVAKMNSTEIDFWRRSSRISRKDKLEILLLNKKLV